MIFVFICKFKYYIFKKNNYEFRVNDNLEKVIQLCQTVKRRNEDTWINDIIINTYFKLYQENKSHSVECYEKNKIIGGLYGVHLGSCFFGESMFSLKSNTSKMCLLYLNKKNIKQKFLIMNIHILGIPHSITSEKFLCCPFTQGVYNFLKIHKYYHYWF